MGWTLVRDYYKKDTHVYILKFFDNFITQCINTNIFLYNTLAVTVGQAEVCPACGFNIKEEEILCNIAKFM